MTFHDVTLLGSVLVQFIDDNYDVTIISCRYCRLKSLLTVVAILFMSKPMTVSSIATQCITKCLQLQDVTVNNTITVIV